MLKKTMIFFFVLLLIILATLSTTLNAKNTTNSYRKPLPSLPVTLNPKLYIDAYSVLVASQIYDRLFDFDELLNLKPNLIKTWSSNENTKIWQFELRDDIFFHNGKELNVDDVIFSITKLLDEDSVRYHELAIIKGAKDYHNGKTKEVSGIKKISNNKFQITLEKSFTPFVSLFAAPNTEILPSNYSGKNKEEFFKNPIGTGPFKFKKYEKNNKLIVIANDNYFRGKPKLNKIIFEQASPEKALKGFNEGYYDDLERYYFLPSDLKRSYTSFKRSQPTTNVIAFNLNKAPFNNKHLRNAITLSIDKNKLQQLCFSNHLVANGFVPPGLGGHYPNISSTEFNMNKAKEEFKNANLSKEQLNKIYIMVRPDNHPCKGNFAKFIEDSAKQLGLKIKVKHLPFNELISKYINNNSFDIYNVTFTADNPEASFILSNFRSDNPHSFGGKTSKQIDAKLNEATEEQDKYERFKIYRSIQELMIENNVLIPLYHEVLSAIFQSNVRGVTNPPLTDYANSMGTIYLEKDK